MEDNIIGELTALLVKDVGMNAKCRHYYTYITNQYGRYVQERKSNEPVNHNANEFNRYARYTLSLVQKWLREIHDVQITIECDFDNKYGGGYYGIIKAKDVHILTETTEHYEECLEVGIQSILMILKWRQENENR